MRKIIIVALTVILLSFGSLAFALNAIDDHPVTMIVNEIAMMALNSQANIDLTTNQPALAGGDVTGDTNSSKQLRYTSLVAGGITRKITASMTGAAPAGTSLDLEAADVVGGAGNTGSAVLGGITLSGTAQNIIAGIGSCATGTANGAVLTYTFNIDTVGDLVVGATAAVVINFTLTDN